MVEQKAEIRLNKFLAERLGMSRRAADDLIAGGKVSVNGAVANLGKRIDKNDKVCYNGNILPFLADFSYLAFHKPVGYVCSRKKQGENPTLYELLPEKYRKLKTVGRLDKNSSGILLLTNDGDFAFRMTHPKFVKNKKYLVKLDKALTPLHQQMIADFGIELKDGKSQLGLTKLTNDRLEWQVEMSEGRNRQIRRTFSALGYTVEKLHRVKFGKFEIANLKAGEFEILKISA